MSNKMKSDKGEMGIGGVIIIIFILVILLGVGGWALGWFGNVGEVAKKEYYPDALLKKYEWFKDASSQLDSKASIIEAMKKKMTRMELAYGNKTRDEWARDDRESYNVWQDEVTGTIASYNILAAEYNSQMSKFNWRFTNVGDLPSGEKEPLPREYRTYKEE